MNLLGTLSQVMAALAALIVQHAAAQPAAPQLRYEPPPSFYRSAITPPEDYSANEFNAGLQVYPFRPVSGNVEQAFRQTLLREWIDPRYRETNLAAPPEIRQIMIAGAQMALSARFAENIAGIPRQRMRMLIVSGNAAALVDASANNLATWQRALPALNAMAATLRVEAGAPPPKMTAVGAEGRAIAGLYMGTKPKYIVNLNRPAGYGSHVMALHYYLFSADGRVYRAYDEIVVPAGGIGGFDFEAARRADPVNSGRYAVQGNQLHIQMGEGPQLETIAAAKPQEGRVTINTVLYVRQ
jgi:hypothetical protein